MKKFSWFAGLIDGNLGFRVRLFNVMALLGTFFSALMTFLSVFTGRGVMSALLCLAATLLAAGLLAYSYRSGKYGRCCGVTIAVIFLILFPVIFFYGGGYLSAMPSFFIFAVVFTVFMLEGKSAVILAAAELLFYSALCFCAWRFPGLVTPLKDQFAVMAETVAGVVFVSAALGLALYGQLRLYSRQQKFLEQARAAAVDANNTKSAFLANMSHEIRTPIGVILGMNEMILREAPTERIVGYGASVRNAGKMLLALINDILDVTKIEAGKQQVVEEDYRTVDLIAELTQMGREMSQGKAVGFRVDADQELPALLRGCLVSLKQIAVNFLSNAFKYTDAGQVTLTVGQAERKTDALKLRLSVSDTGVGIKKEDLPVIFNVFARLRSPSRKNVEGTGLGLTIAKNLTELMGGTLFVESVPGKGSTFSVEIPQKIMDPAPLSSQGAAAEREAPGKDEESFVAPECSILVVDDNEENLKVLKCLLARTLLSIHTAAGGEEALEKTRQRDYDAVLIDYMLPGMDGVQTLRAMKAQNERFSVPAIAVTANAAAGAKERFLSEGFCGCLFKPLNWRELESALRACLPAGKVTSRTVFQRPPEPLSPEERSRLRDELGRRGIALDGAVSALGGDLALYGKLASFFIQASEKNLPDAEAKLARGDFKGLRIMLHSLKSTAKALGAADLSNDAARVERACEAGDDVYAASALPLLRLEWRRAAEALSLACRALGAAEISVSGESASALDEEEKKRLRAKVMEALGHNRRKEALDILSVLRASEAGARRGELDRVMDSARNLDFDRAEALFAASFPEQAEAEKVK